MFFDEEILDVWHVNGIPLSCHLSTPIENALVDVSQWDIDLASEPFLWQLPMTFSRSPEFQDGFGETKTDQTCHTKVNLSCFFVSTVAVGEARSTKGISPLKITTNSSFSINVQFAAYKSYEQSVYKPTSEDQIFLPYNKRESILCFSLFQKAYYPFVVKGNLGPTNSII